MYDSKVSFVEQNAWYALSLSPTKLECSKSSNCAAYLLCLHLNLDVNGELCTGVRHCYLY